MAFTPHSKTDVASMLATIGVKSVDELFDEIPKDLQSDGLSKQKVPKAINEMEAQREFAKRAKKDEAGLCFIGAGAYEHHIPAAVWDVVSRGEFLTAYTPYQAEASQGTLQVIYEYQTMMASLMGLEVSNASLYDGATALAEAVLMAIRSNRKSTSHKILMPETVHPNFRAAVAAIVKNQNIELIELPYCPKTGKTQIASLEAYENADIAALIIPQPNFFGVLEEVDALTNWAAAHQALAIACVNPQAMALLKEPGKWGENGVDIACGSGQPLGVPLASGGPYFGFLCCKKEFVRQMPGRIVGRTVDTKNRIGYALTLQAREQHIRRAKATSNICTNQGLLMTAATIYMALVGPEGLKQIAATCHGQTKKLVTALTTIEGVEKIFDSAFFHEAIIKLPINAEEVNRKLASHGIQGGYALNRNYPELGNAMLICATETKTDNDIAYYQQKLAEVLATTKKSHNEKVSAIT